MSGEPARLMPDTDRLSGPANQSAPAPQGAPDAADEQLMRRGAALGTMDQIARGEDPLTSVPRFGGPIPYQLEIERRFMFEQQRTRQLNDAVFANPESGWGQIKSYMDDVFARYRERNAEKLIKKPANEQEAMKQAEQMQPITVDPNEIASIRQQAVKLDQIMKSIDPRISFWTHPQTRKYAQWLNREAGGTGYGYLSSGEQKLDIGVTGTAAMMGVEAIEGAADFGLNLMHGLWDLSRQGIATLGGGDIGTLTPTNYIEGADGKLYDNGGKVPSFLDSMTALWAAATDQNIQQAVARMGRTRELEVASRNGFQTIVLGASRIAGMGVGFGVPAGAAMKGGAALFGGLTNKGLHALGALKLGRGAEQSSRALKIVQLMSKGMGAAVGNGVVESVAYGRFDGYGHSMLHGMAMAPVLMSLGAMGRRAEWFARNRVNMPEKVAQMVGAGLEGVGFGAMEAHFPDLLPSAWGFIKNPSEETWETYAKNMAGFMMFSIAARGRSVNPANQGRRQFAEQVAAGTATPEQMQRAPTGDVESLRRLGEASRRLREAKTPQERDAARAELEALESERDVREMGLEGPATREVESTWADLQREQQAANEGYQGEAREARRAELEFQDPRAKERHLAREREAKGGPLKEAWRMESLRRRAKLLGGEAEAQYRRELEKFRRRKQEGRGEPITEFVEGREPTKMRPVESDLGAPASRMFQEGGREGLDPERYARPERRKTRAEEVGELPDPLEDPRFMELPEVTRQEILAAPTAQARKEAFAAAAPERRGAAPAAEQASAPDAERALGSQVPELSPTRQLEASEGARRVRMSDIILEMQGRPGKKGFRIPFTSKVIGAKEGDPVRVTMRGGQKLGKGVLGQFQFYENIIRSKDWANLAEKSHEWSHRMHRGVLGKGQAGYKKMQTQQLKSLPTEVVNEIMGVVKDYPGIEKMPANSVWAEVWAEWHARNLLGETELDARFPNLSKWMRSWLAKPEQARLRDQYQRIQEMIYAYNAQGSLNRARESMVKDTAPETPSEKATRPSWLQRAADVVTKAFFDDMIELKRAQDRVLEETGRSIKDVPIDENPARMIDTLAMTAGKVAERFIQKGIKTTSGDVVPGLEPIMKSMRGRESDFATYAMSRRMLDASRQGKKTPLPVTDYVQAIKELEAANPDFRAAATDLKRWTDALVDYVAESGNLSPESAQRIKDAYTVYVPLFRKVDAPPKGPGNRGHAERGTGMARFKGSDLEVRDPLVALQEVATSLIAKAHQNEVMHALYRFAQGHEAGGIATVIPQGKVPKDHPVKQLLDLIEKKMEIPEELREHVGEAFDLLRELDAMDPSIVTTFHNKVIPTGERAVVAFTPRLTEAQIESMVARGAHEGQLRDRNNKLIWMELDPKVYKTMMGVNTPAPLMGGAMMAPFRVARDVLRFFATGVDAGFSVANAFRDMLTKPMFSKSQRFNPFEGFIDFVVGGRHVLDRKSQFRELFDEMGAATASFYNEGVRRQIVGESAGIIDKIKRGAYMVERPFAAPENFLRMAEFKKAYEQAKADGKPERVARLEALESSKEIMNFARGGTLSRALNQIIPYFNATFVGKRKLYRALTGAEGHTPQERAARQRNAMLNGLVNITGLSVLSWAMGKDEEWYQDLPDWRRINYWNFKIGDQIIPISKPFEAGALFGTSMEEFLTANWSSMLPVDRMEIMKVVMPFAQGWSGIIPALVRPPLEVAANYDFFRGRALTPEYISRTMPTEEQAHFYTTATARLMSKMMPVLSPIEWEQIMSGYTAGAFTSTARIFENLKSEAAEADENLLDWTINASKEILRMTQTEHGQSAHVERLYELSTYLDQRSDSLSGREARLKTEVNRAKRRIGELRKQHRDGRLSRQEADRRAYEIARPVIERSKR